MADEPNIQSPGRKENAAQPLDAGKAKGPEQYPAVKQDEAVERTGRTGQVAGEQPSFAPGSDTKIHNEHAGMGDATTDGEDVPASPQQGHLGPGGDPAEGKR